MSIAIQNHDSVGKYRHHSGTIYHVVAITNEKATKDGWVVEAVYFDESGTWWSRPLEDFLKNCQKI